MKLARPVTRLSRRSSRSTARTARSVVSRRVPMGIQISTANWLRSAAGKNRCCTLRYSSTPAPMDNTPTPMVSRGQPMQKASSRL